MLNSRIPSVKRRELKARRARVAVVYFGLGMLIGGLAGLIAGNLFFENQPWLVATAAAAGALIFGVLGVLFKERVAEFFPWY